MRLPLDRYDELVALWERQVEPGAEMEFSAAVLRRMCPLIFIHPDPPATPTVAIAFSIGPDPRPSVDGSVPYFRYAFGVGSGVPRTRAFIRVIAEAARFFRSHGVRYCLGIGIKGHFLDGLFALAVQNGAARLLPWPMTGEPVYVVDLDDAIEAFLDARS